MGASLQTFLKNRDKIFRPDDPPELKERLASRLWLRFVKPRLDKSLNTDELEQARMQFVTSVSGGTPTPLSPGFGVREPQAGLGTKLLTPIGAAAVGQEKSLQNVLRFFGAKGTAEAWGKGTRELEEAIAPGRKAMPRTAAVSEVIGSAVPMMAGFEAGAAAMPFGAAPGAGLLKGAIQNIPKAVAGGIASAPTTAESYKDIPAEAAKMAVLGPAAEIGLGAAFRAPGALARAVGKGAAPMSAPAATTAAATTKAAAPTGLAYFEDLSQKLYGKTLADLAPADKTKLVQTATRLSAFETKYGPPSVEQSGKIISGQFDDVMKEAAKAKRDASKAAKAATTAAKAPAAPSVRQVSLKGDTNRVRLLESDVATLQNKVRAMTGVTPSQELTSQIREMVYKGQSQNQILENLQLAVPEEVAKKVATENPQVAKAVEAAKAVAPAAEAPDQIGARLMKEAVAKNPSLVKTAKAPKAALSAEPQLTLEQLREAQTTLNEAVMRSKISPEEWAEKNEILQARIDKMLGVAKPTTVTESGKTIQTKSAKRTAQRRTASKIEGQTQQEQQLGGGKRKLKPSEE